MNIPINGKRTKFSNKIESVFETNFDKKTYKKIEYFYTFKNKKYINYISFQMQEDLYNKYIHQALFIINSLGISLCDRAKYKFFATISA